jgi:hypothetical protein
MSFENTYSDPFVVSGMNNGLRQDDKTSKYTKYGLTLEDFDITKAYIEAKLYVVIGIRCAINHAEYCLIFNAIPDGREGHGMAHSVTTEVGYHLTAGETMPDWNNGTMFVAVGDFVKTIEGVIPSVIRLETPKYVKDFFREIPAPTVSNVARFTFGLCEREVSFPGVSLTCSDSSRISNMVERRTNIRCDMASLASKLSRDFTDELDPMGVRSGFRVVLDNSLVRIELEKVRNLPFEIINQYVCVV